MGSIRKIVATSGAVLYGANYYSFGGTVPGSESGTGGDRFRFAGREWDSEIALYFNRARYYDPSTARFVGEDPLQFAAGDSNLYRYALNAPTLYKDPIGLGCLSLIGAPPGLLAQVGIGGAAGAAGLGLGIGYAASRGVTMGVRVMDPPTYTTTVCIPLDDAPAWAMAAPPPGPPANGGEEAKRPDPNARVLQGPGKKVLTDRTRKGLGLTKGEAKQGIEGLKADKGLPNDWHSGKIYSNGEVWDADTGRYIGNIYEYVP